MTRKSTWEADLNAYLAAVRKMPFRWGAHDCALYIAGAVEVMTGVDPAAAYRGQYSTELGAAKALKKLGAGTLEATLDATFPPIATGFIGRGDLAWNGESVGVCIGADALFVGEEGSSVGLVRIPRREWVKGWRVG